MGGVQWPRNFFNDNPTLTLTACYGAWYLIHRVKKIFTMGNMWNIEQKMTRECKQKWVYKAEGWPSSSIDSLHPHRQHEVPGEWAVLVYDEREVFLYFSSCFDLRANLTRVTSPLNSITGSSLLIFSVSSCYFLFTLYLPRCTLPDFTSVSSPAFLPFLPCCHRTTNSFHKELYLLMFREHEKLRWISYFIGNIYCGKWPCPR